MALRQLSGSCEFGQYLSEALRDRFVSGLTSESMQRKLLSQKDLTFRQACEIASSMELASRNTLEMAGKTNQLKSVNVVKEAKLFQRREKGKFKGRDNSEKGKYQKREQRQEESYKCYRCAGNHSARDCRFKNEKCHMCNKIRHIARASRNKSAAGQTQYVEA